MTNIEKEPTRRGLFNAWMKLLEETTPINEDEKSEHHDEH